MNVVSLRETDRKNVKCTWMPYVNYAWMP